MGHILVIVKGIHGAQRDCSWEQLARDGAGFLVLCVLPRLLTTLNSFGICTQEVLEGLYSASESQLCVTRVRGQGWKEGKHPSFCISICWEPSLASRQVKEPG